MVPEAEDNLLRIQSKKKKFIVDFSSNLTSVPERFIIMKNEIDHEVRETNDQFSERQFTLNNLKIKLPKLLFK